MKFFIAVIIISTLFSFGTCQAPKTNLQTQLNSDTTYKIGERSSDGIGKYYLGREISFIMGAEGEEWLERNNRDQEENTNLAIEKMNVSAISCCGYWRRNWLLYICHCQKSSTRKSLCSGNTG